MIPIVYNAPLCDKCGEPKVDVYQDEGDFCLSCWADKTTPYITLPPGLTNRCMR